MKPRQRPEKTLAEFLKEVHSSTRHKLERITFHLGSSLADVLTYGKKDLNTMRARAACFEYLVVVEKKSKGEVAKMFGRDWATVARALRRREIRKI